MERPDSGVSVWTQAVARRVALLSCLTLALGLAPQTLAEGVFKVDWTAGRLTVIAENAPLGHVLSDVARRTGLRIRGAEALREQVTVSFSVLPLAEGIRRLLARVDHVIVEQPFQQGDVRPTLVLLARKHRPDAGDPTAGPELSDDPVAAEESLDNSLTDPDPAVRRQAVEQLAEDPEGWGFARLMGALPDENLEVREGAVTALGSYEAMLKDPDPLVRRAAVEGLGLSAGPTTSEALRSAALDEDVGVREAALDALGIYGRDPQLALKEAIREGDKAAQAVAEELIRSGLWDAAGSAAVGDEPTPETLEVPSEPADVPLGSDQGSP